MIAAPGLRKASLEPIKDSKRIETQKEIEKHELLISVYFLLYFY